MTLPNELELSSGLVVRYEYDPGEEQYFDARAGVGSPGYPPEFYVTEIKVGDEWKPAEDCAHLDVAAIEAEAAQKLIDWQSAENAQADEAKYQAWQEMKELDL